MITTILSEIEKIVASYNPKNTILKPSILRLYSYCGLIIAISIPLLYLFIFHPTIPFFLLALLPLLLFNLLFWIDINRNAKKYLKELGITPNNNFFAHWANDNYMEKKQEWILDTMRKNQILPESEAGSILLLKKYATLFKEKSRQNFFGTHINSIVGISLLFIIPYWSCFLSIFLQKDSSINDLYFTFKLLILILFMIIIHFLLLQPIFKQIIFRQHTKWEDISQLLYNIEIELEIKIIKKGNKEKYLISRNIIL